MVCLVVEHSPEAREGLCLALLELGVLGLPTADAGEARAALKSRPDIQAALIDVDNRDVGAGELAADLDGKGLYLLAHSVQERLPAALAGRFRGVVLKPFDARRSGEALRALLAGAPTSGEKRQHIRVVPPAEALVRAAFRITAGSRLYSGRVRNISVGGAAIEIYNAPSDTAIRVGWRIPRIEFNIGSPPLAPSAVIVLYRRRLMAVRFEAMKPQERQRLARYVYSGLTRA